MFKRIKKWFKPNLYSMTWYKYEMNVKFKDNSEGKYTTHKYTYWNENNKKDFIDLILLRNRMIKINEIFHNVNDIKEVTYSIIDKIELYYTDGLDVVYRLGELATKEQLEEYNKKILK